MKKIVFIIVALLINSCSHRVPTFDISKLKSGKSFNRVGAFVIGPRDQLSVTVYGDEKLSGEYIVSNTGILNLPLIPPVDVSGLTALQVSKKLQVALKNVMKYPRVSVSIIAFGSMRVFLLGEVKKVGFVELQGKTNIMQAVSMAGGLTDFATGRIVLIRNSRNNTAKRYSTTWDDVLDGKYSLDFKYLESGDTLFFE